VAPDFPARVFGPLQHEFTVRYRPLDHYGAQIIMQRAVFCRGRDKLRDDQRYIVEGVVAQPSSPSRTLASGANAPLG
jgi:hypothetical protein